MATRVRVAEAGWDRDGKAGSLAASHLPIWRRYTLGRRLTPSLWIGGGIVLLLLVVAALAPLLTWYSPDLVMAESRLQPPSPAHPFGTDSLGRDMFSRVVYGARIAVGMAVLGVGIAMLAGVALGLMAGYRGNWSDQVLSRMMEVWLAFPSLLLAIVIVARLGPSLKSTVIALGIVGVPSFYRLTRASTLSVRRAEYVEAVQAVGARDHRILLRHVLPNVAPTLVVLATMRLGALVLAAGGLSFIGLGARPPQPEWGALLAAGRDYMDTAPWLAIFPGICITLTVVGFNLLGDGLRDAMDPRLRYGKLG
jgi:peptide/nickel transport system permease protein